MKKILVFIFVLIPLINFAHPRNVLLTVSNYFNNRVDVEVKKGGRFGGGGIDGGNIVTRTLQANEKDVVMIARAENGDVLNVIGKFVDGSSFNFFSFSVSASTAPTTPVDLKPENSQVVKDSSQYFKELMDNFFNNSSILNPLKLETDAKGAFDSYLGALVIVQKDENGNYKEVDRIRPTVLKNNEEPKFSPDRSKRFEYTFEANFVSRNKLSILGITDASIDITTGNYYKFNYTAIGFGKVLHSDPDEKSIETRFEALDDPTKASFLMALAKDEKNNYEVRVYNEALVYKGMYLKIEEYVKASLNDKVNIATIFSNDGVYSRRQDQVYEDIYGPTMLSVGFRGEEKTAYFKSKTMEYLQNLLKRLNGNEITVRSLNDQSKRIVTDKNIFPEAVTTEKLFPEFKNKKEAKAYITGLLEKMEKDKNK